MLHYVWFIVTLNLKIFTIRPITSSEYQLCSLVPGLALSPCVSCLGRTVWDSFWQAYCLGEIGPELSGGQSSGEYTLVGLLPGGDRPRAIRRTIVRSVYVHWQAYCLGEIRLDSQSYQEDNHQVSIHWQAFYLGEIGPELSGGQKSGRYTLVGLLPGGDRPRAIRRTIIRSVYTGRPTACTLRIRPTTCQLRILVSLLPVIK